MRRPTLLRAGVLGVVLSLAASVEVFADTVAPDADTLTSGRQSSLDLGNVAPGRVVHVPVEFILACAGLQHLDPDQRVAVTIDAASVPTGGAIHMDAVEVGPVPAGWPVDGEGCSASETPLTGSGTVMITAPPGTGTYEIPVIFGRTPAPDGRNDGSAIGGMTAATYGLTVVENTPPVLVLPGAITVEGDTAGGWTATWSASSTDAEDDPDPTPICTPAVGEVIPFGTTTVTCSVTDTGGLGATGSFDVTVIQPARLAVLDAPVAVLDAPVAVFGPPIKNGQLVGHAGRTIPMKVRLMLDDVSVGEGALVLVVTPCEGGDPVAELEMDWRAGSQRWFGHLRTRGWEPGCYAVRAMHDGVDVGGAMLTLTGKGAEAVKTKVKAKAEAPGGAVTKDKPKKDKGQP